MREGGKTMAILWKPMSASEKLKYEAAEELGLLDKLIEVGWSGLTARETGLIGARVAGRRG
ncbi:MAG: small acid-soluble spore protein alpha/beta type [Clostridia bacterium]